MKMIIKEKKKVEIYKKRQNGGDKEQVKFIHI